MIATMLSVSVPCIGGCKAGSGKVKTVWKKSWNPCTGKYEWTQVEVEVDVELFKN